MRRCLTFALPRHLLLAALLGAFSASSADESGDYAALLDLFAEFRAMVPPERVDGIPDYSTAAMAAQFERLGELRRRLDAIDDSDWPVSRRVDYTLVLAEMRGLEFQHAVLRPWERDPAFYSTTNLGFGPKMDGAMSIPALPLTDEEAAAFDIKLAAVPAILEQARRNLTDARGDLARLGITQKQIELNVYSPTTCRKAARPSPAAPRKRPRRLTSLSSGSTASRASCRRTAVSAATTTTGCFVMCCCSPTRGKTWL